MLCPFCLKENTITKEEIDGRIVYNCSENHPYSIPISYAENEKIPRDIISAVGFRGHGKTTYFSALFASLDPLAQVWPNFSTHAVNYDSEQILLKNVGMYNSGEKPQSTPQTFPNPAIILFSKMPKFKDRFLIFYDTGGENFLRPTQLVANAHFVKRSRTALFFISLHDIDYNPQDMHHLLTIYIQGLKELGGNPKDQNLLIVLTKGDFLEPKLHTYPQIWNYLITGDVKNTQYFEVNNQIEEMKRVSTLLKSFLRQDLGAANFVNLGETNFRSMEVCIISAYNYSPEGETELPDKPAPKRIFDPILWVLYNSTGWRDLSFRFKKNLTHILSKKSTSNQESSSRSKSPEKRSFNTKKVTFVGVFMLFLFLSIYIVFFSNIHFPALSLPLLLGNLSKMFEMANPQVQQTQGITSTPNFVLVGNVTALTDNLSNLNDVVIIIENSGNVPLDLKKLGVSYSDSSSSWNNMPCVMRSSVEIAHIYDPHMIPLGAWGVRSIQHSAQTSYEYDSILQKGDRAEIIVRVPRTCRVNSTFQITLQHPNGDKILINRTVKFNGKYLEI